ncbi:MAG TPA: methyltransferase domain-containing protein [Acidimicrobiales bacterium]|nr:methyltransferase domain-containing protein [Acidimicrobiales bacterium]
MLTVDFRRLGLQPGDRLLDLGCGAGRHAFAAVERGARVTAVDADDTEIKGVAAMLSLLDGEGTALVGDALALPFPDGAFDRVIAAEVLEHIPGDTAAIAELVRVLRPGGTIAVTVPRWGPELLNWALSDDYHSVEGGHVRIYRRRVLEARLRDAGLRLTGRHHAHALHSPYWWLKCAVGVRNEDHPLVRAYHRLLVWDITSAPAVTRVADRVLNPVLGKSVVLYGAKAP